MTEVATFGAGCFWGVEEIFRKVPGVVGTKVGYSGGKTENPTYEQVCSGQTGHAEVVQVIFDSSLVTYDELLKIFWDNHNPTQMNRQGPDIGTQYRSVIFYHTPEQQKLAEKSKIMLEQSGKYSMPLATVIEPAQPLYLAEDYHQQYLAKRGVDGCHM